MTDYATLKESLSPLDSSAIAAAAWADGTLTVTFGSGPKLYCYAGVPRDLYAQLLVAKSPGKFFQAEIRGKFDATVVEPPPEPNSSLENISSADAVSGRHW